jgi:hypothetical protein
VFSCLSLAEFKTAMQPSLDAHGRVRDLRQQLRIAVVERDAADSRVLELIYRLGYAVKGEPVHGRNSVLCEALGYTRETVRRARIRRGRRRKG